MTTPYYQDDQKQEAIMTELTPLDPRIEATAKAIHDADPQCWCPDIDDQCWDTASTAIRDTYVRLAKAAAEALGVTL